MPALGELQRQFVAAMASGHFDALAAHVRDYSSSPQQRLRGSTPQRRLALYRHNTIANLRGALRQVYGVVEALVGSAFFNHAVDQYIAAHASVSGDLNDYGGDFAAFLATFAPAADLPYLADVARLEWAVERAHYAADHAPFSLARLAAVPPDEQGGVRLQLNEAATLLRSNWPLLAIWQVHRPDYVGDRRVDIDSGGVDLLVSRRNLEPLIEPLDRAEFLFLALLQAQQPLAVAVSAALEQDPAFPLQARLSRRIAEGDIVDFK